MTRILFHRAAKSELIDAVAYYETQSAGLGDEFLREVEEALQSIARNPRIGSLYKTTGLRHVRVRRFPYVVFYLNSQTTQTLWIVAVAHGKRRPDY